MRLPSSSLTVARTRNHLVTMPTRLIPRILRVNHAGKHGAVAIYSAQLAHARRAHPDLIPWLEDTLAHAQTGH